MFGVYEDFEYHERNFNVIFATSVAVVMAFLIGGVLAANNFFTNPVTWLVFVVLVMIPVIVFITVSGDMELKTAYYRLWGDKIHGVLDRNKILKQFAKQYGIENWRTKAEDIEADGRWNFHVDTDYMHHLTEHRNLLLGQIRQEYLNKLTEVEKVVDGRKLEVNNARNEVQASERLVRETEILLNKAKSAGEIYKQRKDYNSCVDDLTEAKKRMNAAEHGLSLAEEDRENLRVNYNEVVCRVKKLYDERYVRYVELAIKKISQVNGLKFVVEEMPNAEMRLKGSRKETK